MRSCSITRAIDRFLCALRALRTLDLSWKRQSQHRAPDTHWTARSAWTFDWPLDRMQNLNCCLFVCPFGTGRRDVKVLFCWSQQWILPESSCQKLRGNDSSTAGRRSEKSMANGKWTARRWSRCRRLNCGRRLAFWHPIEARWLEWNPSPC